MAAGTGTDSNPVSKPARYTNGEIECPPGYEPVFEALRDAMQRCSNGKGNERHATEGEPFAEQSMLTDARLMNSPDGMVSQIRKKALESRSLDPEEARMEALDIIVYGAGLAYWYARMAAGDDPRADREQQEIEPDDERLDPGPPPSCSCRFSADSVSCPECEAEGG